MRRAALAIAPVMALALGPARALAQDAEPAAPEPPAEPDAADSRAKPEPEREWTLELGGRVFVRDTVSRVDVGEDDLAPRPRHRPGAAVGDLRPQAAAPRPRGRLRRRRRRAQGHVHPRATDGLCCASRPAASRCR